MGFEWFEAFDAVQGVAWEPLMPIDRRALRGADARPRVERSESYDGRWYQHVEWLTPAGSPLADGSGSPSNLHLREVDTGHDPTPEAIARTISEALALPGTRSDYHFGMLSAWGALHTVRRKDARAFRWIEALCLADIALMEQGPKLVFSGDGWENLGDDDGYPVVPAFHQLSSLYQREGFLADAVAIEKRCAALGVKRPIGEGAIARQAALLEEDGR